MEFDLMLDFLNVEAYDLTNHGKECVPGGTQVKFKPLLQM
jgi:hypothetical protein